MNEYNFDAIVECGGFLLRKFKAQCLVSGVFTAARNCRKQGISLDVCLLMLRAK